MSETSQEERQRLHTTLQQAAEKQLVGIPVGSRDGGVTWECLRALVDDADHLARAEELLRRWKLSDEADDKGLLDAAEYDRLINERDAFLQGD